MKKKLIRVLFVLFPVIFTLIACGLPFGKNNNANNENDNNKETLSLIKKSIEDMTFEKDPTWNEVALSDCAVQFCDVFLLPGIKAKDLPGYIDKSTLDLSYEFNPDMLINGQSFESIIISYNEDIYVDVHLYNYSNEIMSLKDTCVCSVKPSEEAKKYCYFFDGTHYNEIIDMSLSELNTYADNLLIASPYGDTNLYKREEKDDSTGENIVISLSFVKNSLSYSEWAFDNSILYSLYNYSFYVNKQSGKVIDFDYENDNNYKTDTNPGIPVTSLSELSDEEIEEILVYMEEEVHEIPKYNDVHFDSDTIFLIQRDNDTYIARAGYAGIYAQLFVTKVAKKKNGEKYFVHGFGFIENSLNLFRHDKDFSLLKEYIYNSEENEEDFIVLEEKSLN